MSDPTTIVFTVKELLQRLDERLAAVDQKLDLRLAGMDERITHVERIQSERQYLVAEFQKVQQKVEHLDPGLVDRVQQLETDYAGRKAVSVYNRLWLSLIPVAAVLGFFLDRLAG